MTCLHVKTSFPVNESWQWKIELFHVNEVFLFPIHQGVEGVNTENTLFTFSLSSQDALNSMKYC